jgi:primosomal protein N' (replication factor Y)
MLYHYLYQFNYYPSSTTDGGQMLFSSNTKQQQMFVEVIIPLFLPKNYTYAVPDYLQSAIQIGLRVEVSLKNKKYTGIVKSISKQKPEAFEPKDILNVLDKEPLIHTQQLAFWQWMAQYYMCTEGEVMQAAVPSNFKLNSESILIWNDEFVLDATTLSDEEFIVTEALELKKELRLSEVQQLLDVTHVYPVIKKLIEKQVCYVWEELKQKYKVKTETFILLHPTYHNEDNLAVLLNNWSDKKAPKQMELLLAYLHLIKTVGEVTQPDLLKKANASPAQLKGLVDKNILIQEKRVADRIKTLPKDIQLSFKLSEAQQQAKKGILDVLTEKQVCLLYGLTASGKTQIYIELIAEYIRKGKQVLYMLPEIALTAQIIRRLQQHFGGHIAIYHSKFNANERVEIWNKVKSGEIKAVLGARSSLFLPFKDLGLIIVDEEHDASYKQQDPAPRYHARDAATYYASLFDAKVLLGSGTPSIESYHNCSLGKYGLVNLLERFGNAQLPHIQLVDLKLVTTKEVAKVIISPQLKAAIEATLEQQKQVILFQNRRGYAPYLLCGTCGWIPQCKHCDVSLTFHKAKNKLACHYCGSTYPVIQTCAACGNHNFVQRNFGTEQVEEYLAEVFPAAKIARMDYDSVKGKNDHDSLIKLFEQRRIDILVGTQMVVKGLDFEHVNLVGILDADGILSFADFRVNERAFQLMEQVSGRAGRKDAEGKVLVQVANMHHPVLQMVKEHDFKKLYDFEITNRKNFFYPPFSRIIQLVFKHKEKHIAEESANLMLQGLKAFADFIKGPAEPVINRVRNQYLFELLLKLPKDAATIHKCKIAIQQQIVILQSSKRYRAVTIMADVDPV